VKSGAQTSTLDLRGVKCPISWARTKVVLEQIAPGETLEVLLDEARGARDIPKAAEAEGYAVIDSTSADGLWRIRIEK